MASGDTLEEVRQQAVDIGIKQPGLEFVPSSDRAFVAGYEVCLPPISR